MKINFTLKRTKNFNNICVAALNRQQGRQGRRVGGRGRQQDGDECEDRRTVLQTGWGCTHCIQLSVSIKGNALNGVVTADQFHLSCYRKANPFC